MNHEGRFGRYSGLGLVLLALSLAGCSGGDDDDGNGEGNLPIEDTSSRVSFETLAGEWSGPGMNPGNGDPIEVFPGSMTVASNGDVMAVREEFDLERDMRPHGVTGYGKIHVYHDDSESRRLLVLVAADGDHVLALPDNGTRPILLGRDAVPTALQNSDLQDSHWAGDAIAVEDFPPVVDDFVEGVVMSFDHDNAITLSIPGRCNDISTSPLGFFQDPGFGLNFWAGDGLTSEGTGADCPSLEDSIFVRVLMSYDRSHIVVSACDKPDEAADGCFVFLLARES